MSAPDGQDLVKHFESLRLTAYPDPATGGKPWTLGWGHTQGVHQGDECSSADAERLFQLDWALANAAVWSYCTGPYSLYELDAMTSFVFNVGAEALHHSTLRRLLLDGRPKEEVVREFLKWDRAGGRVLHGLDLRRRAECLLFLGKDWRDYEKPLEGWWA